MTDIAGLCERLRAITTTDHERLCQGREYACSCGWDAENEAKATKAADTLERQAAEIERLRTGLEKVVAYYGPGHRVTEIAQATLKGKSHD